MHPAKKRLIKQALVVLVVPGGWLIITLHVGNIGRRYFMKMHPLAPISRWLKKRKRKEGETEEETNTTASDTNVSSILGPGLPHHRNSLRARVSDISSSGAPYKVE